MVLIIILITSVIILAVLLTISVNSWLFSKKHPNVWFINKALILAVVGFSIPIAIGTVASHFASKLPSAIFEKHFYYYPPPEIQDLQILEKRDSEMVSQYLKFRTDDVTFHKIVDEHFIRISRDEFENMEFDENNKEFLKSSQAQFYKRKPFIEGDVNFETSLIVYDEPRGTVNFHWFVQEF